MKKLNSIKEWLILLPNIPFYILLAVYLSFKLFIEIKNSTEEELSSQEKADNTVKWLTDCILSYYPKKLSINIALASYFILTLWIMS
jgi:hypothetical protein